jgi:dnd system-associated protein 4
MAELRIKVAKEQAELVQQLVDDQGKTAPFQTFADVVAFAAAVGVKYGKRVKFQNISKNQPAPISLDIFISRGYDTLIKLIAIHETKNIDILANEIETEHQRLNIFEEYANGGLEIIQQELRGSVDYTERLLLMISSERGQKSENLAEFDLSNLMLS